LELLFCDRVLGEQAKRTQVIKGLRRKGGPMARGDHAGVKRKEGILRGCLVGRKPDAIGVAALGADPEAETAQYVFSASLKRSGEKPDGVAAVAAGRGVAQGVVRHAIKDADLVAETVAEQIARQLKADVAAWGEKRRQAALHKCGVIVRLQAFEADRGLELSDAHREVGDVVQLDVRVVDDDRTLTEVRPEKVLHILIKTSRESRSNAAQQCLVRQRTTASACESADIGLEVGAY